MTRKTFTPNYLTHKAKKNRGDRPQSLYRNHHEAIVSRDDFIAVQHLLNNAKYGNKSVLPELRVIESGLLRGFVTINQKVLHGKPQPLLSYRKDQTYRTPHLSPIFFQVFEKA